MSDGHEPLIWRNLLIIKALTDLWVDGTQINNRLSPRDIEAVSEAFESHTPYWVEKLTSGRVRWKTKSVISYQPLTSVSPHDEDGYWVAPGDVKDDIARYAALGEYDGIFVYWKNKDDLRPIPVSGPFGVATGPSPATNHSGFSSVHYVDASAWTLESETTEVFLHEWIHQLEIFYISQGLEIPEDLLHSQADYGFEHESGWKHWYEYLLRGGPTDPDDSQAGFGNPAWQLGTIRHFARFHHPDYVTPELRSQGLLANGSFEDQSGQSWGRDSWSGARVGQIVTAFDAPDGHLVMKISSSEPDDARAVQTVVITPGRRYLLTGWVKTDGVVIREDGGTIGASLGILDTYEVSQSIEGTAGWTYLTLIFDSKDRDEIHIALRLGHYGSTAVGTAWFDDVILVEIPQAMEALSP